MITREISEPVRIVLFDLGGVLVDWDGTKELRKLAGMGSEADASRFWLHSPAVRKFESGQCSAEQFGFACVRELGLAIGPDKWLELFVSWDRGPYPGAIDLLGELGSCFDLGCLSNNNDLHWKRVCDFHGFGTLFDHKYLSHEIGMCKPDPRIFQYVLKDLGLPASAIFYLDDSLECVETALQHGIRAVLARGLEEVRQALSRAQLL
jgi:putative hydrolase of the HAD superfamily